MQKIVPVLIGTILGAVIIVSALFVCYAFWLAVAQLLETLP